MITVSITRYASNAYWSWREHADLLRLHHRPLLRVDLPVRTFINVDLPAPFGPVNPYRRPLVNVTETSSKSSFCPYRIVTLETEIMVFLQFYRQSCVCARHPGTAASRASEKGRQGAQTALWSHLFPKLAIS
jgi:hypothetical protein